MRNTLYRRICFVAGSLGQGGCERQLYHALHVMRRVGATPRVLCLQPGGFWEGALKDLGVPVIHVGQRRSKIARLLRLLKELRQEPPEILQSQHFYTNGYTAIAARVLGLGSIGALRSDGRTEARDCGGLGGWFNLRSPETIAVNSRPAMQYAVQRGVSPHRLFLLGNVVDTAHFHPAPPRTDGRVRLIAVGRLIASKRFDKFISLVARLRRELHQEITGLIVGAGPLKQDLLAQAAAFSLPPPAIEFSGSVTDVAPLYREADVLVMTSEVEGMPNAVLEAMASGLPVVATRVGGVPDAVHEGQSGLLVDPKDEAALLAAVTRLIQNPELRLALGRNARAAVLTHYALDRLPMRLSALHALAYPGPSIGHWFRRGERADSTVPRPARTLVAPEVSRNPGPSSRP